MARTITPHKMQAPDGRVYQAPNSFQNEAAPVNNDEINSITPKQGKTN